MLAGEDQPAGNELPYKMIQLSEGREIRGELREFRGDGELQDLKVDEIAFVAHLQFYIFKIKMQMNIKGNNKSKSYILLNMFF